LGDAFGSGYSGLAAARLLLRNELNPAYPYRIFYFKYDLGDVFCLDFCCLFTLGDAFGPGYFGLAYARLLLRNEPSPVYPYRIFLFEV
jgi:hypothetical protein